MKAFGFFLATIALAISCQAGSVVVTTDSGSIGNFEMTNAGFVGPTATIEITRQPNTQSFMDTVNGVNIIPEPTGINGPIVMLVTPVSSGKYTISLLTSPNTQTFGSSSQANLAFNLQNGVVPTKLPNFFNASGNVTSLIENNNPTYNFKEFSNGLGTENITFTATTFIGAKNFTTFFDTVGSTAIGNGSFSQSAIPEPTSVILLGISLLSGLVYWRFK
jgi:hypothetical protein